MPPHIKPLEKPSTAAERAFFAVVLISSPDAMEDTVVIDALTPAATAPDTAADFSPATTAPANAAAAPPVAAVAATTAAPTRMAPTPIATFASHDNFPSESALLMGLFSQ